MTNIKVGLDVGLISDAIKIISNAIHPRIEHNAIAAVINQLQSLCDSARQQDENKTS